MTELGACGAGFAIHDPEVDSMSAAYAGERAAYWVVELERAGRVVGAGGFAPLAGGDPDTCEVRKMYFYPEARGLGAGAALLDLILETARARGFRRAYLETLATMTAARRLYERRGFVRRERPSGATGHFGCDLWYDRAL
ncbi:MAG: GNAT family N-acetyltransferase [Myxococcales bacterium]|nr:GNAT family N-acetyltransferase [Myxococcales bacterium]